MSARDADYLRREVEMLGRKKDSMESEILELMERKDQQEEHLGELEDQMQEIFGRLQAILDEDVAAFNERVSGLDLPAIVVKTEG